MMITVHAKKNESFAIKATTELHAYVVVAGHPAIYTPDLVTYALAPS
jgi:hypothetical protein